MKYATLKLAGRDHSLAFNGQAMFALKDQYGNDFLSLLQGGTAEGFDALLNTAAILAEQGELVRRYEGHDPQDALTHEELRIMVCPSDIIEVQNAVIKAIMLGYGREIKDDKKDTDLGLLELQKKTGAKSRKRTT